MTQDDLLKEINRLRRERDVSIFAHNYQIPEIQRIADYVGDSLDLARRVAKVRQKVILFCGVTFMAESAKVLNPDKTVLIPDERASCPLADKITPDQVRILKYHNPEAVVVGYINTYAEVKGECDVCCTSANAGTIVAKLPPGDVIFLPDRNLATYAERVSGRSLIKWPGYCYVHHRLLRRPDVLKLMDANPDALVLAHPECDPEVLSLADYVGGTNGMVRYVADSKKNTFIVATEVGMTDRLRREFPQKEFFRIETAICATMKINTLAKVYESLRDFKHIVEVPDETAHGARRALEKMLETP